MPVAVPDNSTAEQIRYRKSRNQNISHDIDPEHPQIPSIIQSTQCKSTISSLLLSTFTPTTITNTDCTTNAIPANTKKKNFTSATFRGLGCTASSQVSVPTVIRSSADWEAKKTRKKKQKSKKKKVPSSAAAIGCANIQSSSGYVVVPDVWCGPGIGFTTDAASVDCVVSRRPASERGNVDVEKVNQRECLSYPTRRIVAPEDFTFLDPDYPLGMPHSCSDAFRSRHHPQARYRFPEELSEIVMLQNSLLMGGRSDGLDRYRYLRLDVDNMTYEELLELGDRIGYVSTGLKEDEIIRCLRKAKFSYFDVSSHLSTELGRKCSICQEEYGVDDEMGNLDCGHFYHIHCIKQWLSRKNTCPICKTTAAS